MLVNTGEIRTQIQAEIDKHLALAASLQEKLSTIAQIEHLVSEVVGKPGDLPKPLPKPEAKLEPKPEVKPEVKLEAPAVAAPIDQTIQEVPTAAKDGAGNTAKNPWACMQQGFQAYLAGKLDRALELFREARELNPGGFEKTWATMTSIPVYSSVARDKYFIEGLFSSK
jgi:hypothetical protein